ncbi:Multiple EGF-like-domain protein 3 precursor [Enhygromyxa salina]|uniref:Multiple EGF-like-domain protein 3 n=1 Tax=Enhygromyxa salina TaxID=215803 RepID=A0A0C2A2J3_9BACT|nr:Multiple EGF-like-domain protein 3 precursor [Enhygromyxa salina]
MVLATALSQPGCVAVVIESNLEGETGDGDPGDGDGDGDPGDGDGDPGDGDGDTNTNTGDGDGDTNTGDGDPDRFRVVVIADPHIPAPDYPGGDKSLSEARASLLETRDKIEAIVPPPSFVVVLGDLVDDAYKSTEAVWYQANPNAFADVADILDGFSVPVYPLFGDSDYAVPDHAKTFSHLLFGQFYAKDPYYAVDHLGWRFVFTNSEYGQTYDEGTLIYDPERGSYGGTQLNWIADQLSAGKPTVLFSHFPLYQVAVDEAPNNGQFTDLETVLAIQGEPVELVFAGHEHTWLDMPATFAAPHVVVGATRYDTDNFLLIEFTTNTPQYEMLDRNKVEWGTAEADTWVYDGTPMPG